MIVLAIAGLIMVVVLVAVPQLQRSQRNSASTAVLDRVFTELSNYASNNNGSFPDTSAELNTFCTRYLEKTGNTCNNETGAAFVNDPRTGNPMRLGIASSANTQPTALPSNGNSRTITIYAQASGSGFSCNGETITTGTGARSIAAVVPLEGGAFACRDNR